MGLASDSPVHTNNITPLNSTDANIQNITQIFLCRSHLLFSISHIKKARKRCLQVVHNVVGHELLHLPVRVNVGPPNTVRSSRVTDIRPNSMSERHLEEVQYGYDIGRNVPLMSIYSDGMQCAGIEER